MQNRRHEEALRDLSHGRRLSAGETDKIDFNFLWVLLDYITDAIGGRKTYPRNLKPRKRQNNS